MGTFSYELYIMGMKQITNNQKNGGGMTKTQIRKILKKYIGDTVERYGLKRKGYRCEYQLVPYGVSWDGDYWTLNELVDDMMDLREGKWDIWITGINGYVEPECMNYQEFNVDEIIANVEGK